MIGQTSRRFDWIPGARRISGRLRVGRSRPPIGEVQFGHLRRLNPISRTFGYDRGQPVDRYYIEQFLDRNSSSIKGRVLEVGDDSYTSAFGGERVTQSDVLHVHDGNPQATFVGDLTRAENIPSDCFDCIILTQTLHLIYDIPAAVRTLHRILKPHGVLLATVPGISQTSDDEWETTWYWSFTRLSAQKLLTEYFPESSVEVETFGNVLAATAFLHGLSAQELTTEELAFTDPHYQVLISIKATKPKPQP